MFSFKFVHNSLFTTRSKLASGGGGALEWQEEVSGSPMDTQKAP